MRFRLLLIFLFCSVGILRSQDTIRTLIISEARIDNQHAAYVELTNVGATTLDLSQFEFGKVGPWTQPYTPGTGDWFMLPSKSLAPGQSFVIAKATDYTTRMWAIKPDQYDRYTTKPEIMKKADMLIHIKEATYNAPQALDSVSPYASAITIWNGSYCWYLRYHFKNALDQRDSAVIDQVGGIFDDTDGTSRDIMHDVAGYTNATGNAVLIRKATVAKGNLNFDQGRGTNIDESEWIVVPFLVGGWEPLRAMFWTTGNHGDYKLSSLTSSVMTINWTDSTLTVPWGVRNDDSIMYKFNRVPGIAWHYDYSPNHADSAYVSVRTGDKLTVYACGNKVEKIIFKIVASPATDNDNKVIPKKVPNNRGWYTNDFTFCEVTDGVPGMDTILRMGYATRVDTLLKYLEKPAQASWSFVWVDGVPRADLKMGDILRVTSKNGASKDYYIKPNKYFPSHNAYLSSITWPDIPEFYKGIMGWTGDTIPNFLPSKKDYKLMVPWDVDGIPGLIAHKQQLNAKLSVTRATSLAGGVAERTITFTNVAEDDTTIYNYKVELIKEKDVSKIQPWDGDPFISQFVWKQDYNNEFLEVVNPRPFTMDMSNYMLAWGYYGSASEAITSNSGTGNFATRYRKYIPGYKWVNQATWASTPGIVEVDPNVNPIINGGDVFVMAFLNGNPAGSTFPTFVKSQVDVDFKNNTWGEDLTNPWDATLRQWWGQKWMLFKILNDSVRTGLKPANNPNDFELIDIIGDPAGNRLVVGGNPMDQVHQYVRKPKIWKGNTVIGGSNGTTEENSEWIMMNETRYQAAGYGWPTWRVMVADGIGTHFMNEVTVFKSTVSSTVYKVSDGYTDAETIKGLGAGINVNAFFANIIKADTGQHLKVVKGTNGSVLSGTDIVSTNDTLIVVSADSVNTSKYIIDAASLSNNAVLTASAPTTINVTGNTGTVGGFAYGTKLKNVVAAVTVPSGAAMEIIDSKGAYMPLKILNYDTTYVDVTVSDKIFFIVTAEDGVTKITYQLKPNASATDAFVTSDVYGVDQAKWLINIVPNGTSVSAFLSNIVPVTGASIKLVDKYGLERTMGVISKDDKLVVTAADGITKNTYYLSMLNIEVEQYLAYVLSSTYAVDQVGLKITGSISTSNTVSQLLGNLTPATAATAKVLDKNGAVKASGVNLAIGDVVQVTSGDGKTVVIYIITNLVKAPVVNKELVYNIYIDNSSSELIVNGIQAGNRIYVLNTSGKIVKALVARSTYERIPIGNQAKGVYLVKVVAPGKQNTVGKVILK